jgi:hypothetical protein
MIVRLARVQHGSQLIPLLFKGGLGVVGRRTEARAHHTLPPPPAEEGNRSRGSRPCPSADGHPEAMKMREAPWSAAARRRLCPSLSLPRRRQAAALQGAFGATIFKGGRRFESRPQRTEQRTEEPMKMQKRC